MNSKGDAKEDATTTFRLKNHDNLQPKRSLSHHAEEHPKTNRRLTWKQHVCSTSKIEKWKRTHAQNLSTKAEPRGKKRIMNPPSKNELVFEETSFIESGPQENICSKDQKRTLYRMGCARLSLFFFWKIDSPHSGVSPESTILYMWC